MALGQAILGFLADGPATGYELKTRCFDAAPRLFWRADQAQVYRTLDRLQGNGLVRSTRKHQRTRPDRREYELTDAGRAAVRAWLSTPHPVPDLRDPFLLQLYLSTDVPNEALVEVFAAQRDVHQHRLDEARAAMAALRSDAALTTRQAQIRRCALEAVAAHARSSVDWIDDCLDVLGSGEQAAEGAASAEGRLF